MGDTNAPSSGHSNLPAHLLQGASVASGSRMDALMSAIEYERRNMAMDPKLAGIDPKLIDSRAMLYGGYSMMANMHNQAASGSPHHSDSRRAEQEGQSVAHLQTSQQSVLYPAHVPFPASGIVSGAAAPYLGLNPMLMPFMSPMLPAIRPTSSSSAPHGSLPQSAATAWASVGAERSEERGSWDSVCKCALCGTLCSDTTDLHTHMQKHVGVVLPHMLPHSPHRGQEDIPSMKESGLGPSQAGRRPDRSSAHEMGGSEPAPNPYTSGVPFFQSGMGLTPDKLASVHDPAAVNMRYPTPGGMNAYLNYQSLLAANPGALLQSVLPSSWNPALGALGYPYYPGGLIPRLPYLPHMPQTSMHVPAAGNPSTPPALSNPSEPPSTKAIIHTRMDPTRPLSGGYLPIKETLQKRLSAPVMVSGSPARVPGRTDGLLQKGSPNYPSFPHRTHLPSQLIAPTPDSSKSVKTGFVKGRIDHKSIEQHISKLISHNEKILTNPTLDRVKPRRVFRRSSLDPSSLSTNPPHNPLTATYSAPRSLEPDYHKPLLDDKPMERNFLTVPSRLTEPNLPGDGPHGDKPFVTVIPDPRRDPNARRLTTNAEIREQLARKASGGAPRSPSYNRVSERAKAVTQELYQQAAEMGQLGQNMGAVNAYDERHGAHPLFRCEDCGVQFSRHENYETHRKSYCLKKLPPSCSSLMRQSVIQHTGPQAEPQDPQTLPKPVVPQVCVTPPPELMASGQHLPLRDPKCFLSSQHSDFLANPMKHFHRDLQRTRSADAAILPRFKDDRVVGVDSPVAVAPSTSKASSKPPSPVETADPKSNRGLLSVNSNLGVTKSSIPTDKLPPKKKQLQLMRSNSSSQSYVDMNKSPSRNTPVSMSPDNSPSSHGSKTPETPMVPEVARPVTESRASPLITITPPSATASPSRTSLPPWIPLDQYDPPDRHPKRDTSPILLPQAPTVYLTQDPPLLTTAGEVPIPMVTSPNSAARSPTSPRSPRSPRSPTRRSSPGRSPSRSPTRSPNLESTIPRSNYKLLLHQLSVRNMQDMDYLSEAYHNSKDKNLKRNIASLLQSSSGTSSSYLGGSYAKRGRGFSPERVGVKMEELYPGKASLARRLSPNADGMSRLSGKYDTGATLAPRAPLVQSRSKPYEESLKPYPSLSVTRSHSAGYSSDINNNIKQYLQNKSRNQQAAAAMEASSQPSKGHKPLRRSNANARYVLKSPTKEVASSQAESSASRLSVTTTEDGGEWKRTVGKTMSASRECTERLKESLALKRASSYNPESSFEYQNKRRKLIPIPQKTTQTSIVSALPASLIAPHVSEKEKRPDAPKIDPADAVRVSSLLYPHLTPKLSFEPHATFCSLLSPQPMYVELERSTLSMYSQWAVSEPLMLPEGLTVMDLFRNTRALKGLSPYVSYSSLFISASSKDEALSVTDTKDYEAGKETKEEGESSVDTASEPSKEEKDSKNNTKGQSESDGAKKIDAKEDTDWIWSRMDESKLLSSKMCYTSCHSRNDYKLKDKKSSVTSADYTYSRMKHDAGKGEVGKTLASKIQPPKVVIHPPSPTNSEDSNSHIDTPTPDLKNDEIAALEFSDDSDDSITDQLSPTNHFLLKKKGALHLTVAIPPSETPNRHTPPPNHPDTSQGNQRDTATHNATASKNGQTFPAARDEKTTVTKYQETRTRNSVSESIDVTEHTDSVSQNVTLHMHPSMTEQHGQGCFDKPCINGPSGVGEVKGESSSHHLVVNAPGQGVEGHSTGSNGLKGESAKDKSNSSMEEGVKGQSSGSEDDDLSRKKNKKVRKSRRERNALSPRLQRRINQFPDSPPNQTLEDPSLAVHPTGACRGLSDDPSRTCALCSMKAEGTTTKSGSDVRSSSNASDDSSEPKSESIPTSEPNISPTKEENICNHEAPTTQETSSSTRPHTPTSSRAKTPTSSNSKPNVPLTVSVPMRNRDRSSTKSTKQSLAPGILDKARGKGTTQHWVTTTDLQVVQSPPDASKSDEKSGEKPENAEPKNEKTLPTISEYDKAFQAGYYSTMPPNKNPVLELNLQKNNEQPQSSCTPTTGGHHALAAVVSGVMRSAAIQSKKKTKNAKLGMNELLSHSRPLIPTSELNGSAASTHARLSEKLKEGQNGPTGDRKESDSLGSLVALTVGLASPTKQPSAKLGTRHLSLSSRESELFLSKANDTKITTPQATLAEYAATKITQAIEETSIVPTEEEVAGKEHDLPSSEHSSPPSGHSTLDEQALQEVDDGQQSDDAKDDSMHDGDGESANPRPHKCAECKVAFRIAGHLAKHLRSKGHIIAMQKKTLNRLKQQQKLSSANVQDTMATAGQGVNSSTSASTTTNAELSQQQAVYTQLEAGKCTNQEELLNSLQHVEGAETLARAQVRALFEGNDEYTEIVTSGTNAELATEGTSDVGEDGEGFTSMSALSAGGLDPRPFKCIACKVAFRFQGHLDRHFRSNMHLLAVGHFERDKIGFHALGHPNMGVCDPVGEDGPHDDQMDEPHMEIPNTDGEPHSITLSMGNGPQIMSPPSPEKSDSFTPEENLPVAMEIESNPKLGDVKNGDVQELPSHFTSGHVGAFTSPGAVRGEKPPWLRQNGPSENMVRVDDNNNVDVEPADSLDNTSITTNSTPNINSLEEVSIETSPASSVTNGPINGLCSVPSDCIKSALFPIGSDVKNAPPPNNDFKTIKQRLSPVIQSNAKPLFEAPPTLPEGPIKANSPVNRQQQLTC